jgi:hypothetical protein
MPYFDEMVTAIGGNRGNSQSNKNLDPHCS